MKKLLVLLLFFVFVLSACDSNSKGVKPTQNQNNNPTTQSAVDNESITRDRAIELALTHAGVTKADVRELEAELDQERNGLFWEVDFEYGKAEYSYDINAKTEEIIKLEKERE